MYPDTVVLGLESEYGPKGAIEKGLAERGSGPHRGLRSVARGGDRLPTAMHAARSWKRCQANARTTGGKVSRSAANTPAPRIGSEAAELISRYDGDAFVTHPVTSPELMSPAAQRLAAKLRPTLSLPWATHPGEP